MKYVLPVAKTSDCPLTLEHLNQIELVMDEFGVTDMRCPAHGRLLTFHPMEFDSLEDLEAFRDQMERKPIRQEVV